MLKECFFVSVVNAVLTHTHLPHIRLIANVHQLLGITLRQMPSTARLLLLCSVHFYVVIRAREALLILKPQLQKL